MVFYTKRGDEGETDLFHKLPKKRKRVSKASLRIYAIGAIDELISALGITSSFSKDRKFTKLVENIQKDLFIIGSILAGSTLGFTYAKVKKLERLIDKLEASLPVLKNFILPGGTKLASQLYFARSVARHAEREVVTLSEVEWVKPQTFAYLNRLSDLIFMLARVANYKLGIKEKVWKGKVK